MAFQLGNGAALLVEAIRPRASAALRTLAR
jgi:hypothetical protein